MAKQGPLEERLWRGVDRSDPNRCWERPGANVHRYPVIMTRVNGVSRSRLATRVSFELANGPIPAGMQVCHRCDNPPCINPAHLFVGTASVNAWDKVAKGRARGPTGTAHPRARLNPDAVRDIRQRAAGGERHSKIARSYGVACAAVLHVVIGRTWKHVL